MQETAYLCKCYRVYAKNAVFRPILTIFLHYESYISSFLQIRKNAKNSQKTAQKLGKTAFFGRNLLIISCLSHLR